MLFRSIPAAPRVPERVRVALERGGERPSARRVYFGPERGWLETPVLVRGDLAAPREGPCIVEEYDATCVVPPGATAALDEHGNIIIELQTVPPRRG